MARRGSAWRRWSASPKVAERVPGPRADLHLHSTASDGLVPPDALAVFVQAAKIRVAALTDHDTTHGFAAFAPAARALGIQPIPGAEIAALHDGEEVHLLAYFAVPPEGPFAELLAALSRGRGTRAEEMLRRLAAMGIALPDAQEILAHPQVGRPHVARALVRLGLARDTSDAFDRFLVPGKPAYVERLRPQAKDAIARAHADGGIVSLAHPGHYRTGHLSGLRKDGLDAVEVNHPSAARPERQALLRAARQLGLITTGGSDFHGAPGARPGRAALPPAQTERFLERIFGHRAGD